MSLNSKKIAVVYGGPSNEAEVSAKTASAIFDSLQKQKFNAVKIEFSQKIAEDLLQNKIDIVFNAMHGAYGEDGCLQGLLEIIKIPYTHSGVLATALGMSKPLTKQIVKDSGVNLAKGTVKKAREVQLQKEIKLPFVVKPVAQGSTRNVFFIRNTEDLKNLQIPEGEYLIEELIDGRELSVAVLDDKALGIVEIRPKSGIYDYASKYTKGATEYICPAELPENIAVTAKEYAEKAHILLGCKGVTRSDILYDGKTQKLYFLEINTHPGMTETSLVPKMANSVGINFDNLVLKILGTAKLEIS